MRATSASFGRAVAALAADPAVRRRSQPDCWRYMVEVQDAGRPADATGYR
jgi:hypothetical protein